MANLIKYGNLALDNLLTLGQISNKKHSDRQIDRQIGLSSMVALFIYKTLGGLRRNNNYNNVTHFSTFPIIFKIIATLFNFYRKTKKKKVRNCMLLMELLKPCVDYCNVPPDSMKNEGHIFHSYVTESNLHGVRDYAYRDIFVVMRESTVISFPTLSTYIVPERNNKQVSESCLITTGALGNL